MIRPASWIGTAALIVVLWALSFAGCHPDPPPPLPPPPPPTTTTTYAAPPQPVAQPTYRPTTEEWVHFPARILYPSGGARLDDTARAMLREAHASMAARTDIVRVRVEGHADGQGNSESNQRLGMERAQGVVDFLVGDLGLPRELFETVSFGDERPLTSESEPLDRVQNRRVEFSVLVRRQAAP